MKLPGAGTLVLGRLVLVAFGHYGTTVHNPAGATAEKELSLVGSALCTVSRLAEALVEVEVCTRRTAVSRRRHESRQA